MQDGQDMVSENTMTLDGKECKSEVWNSPRVTKAKWSATGDTLNIEIKLTFNQDGNINETLIKETWSLREKGKCIIIDHFSTSNWGDRKLTMVYNKKEVKQ